MKMLLWHPVVPALFLMMLFLTPLFPTSAFGQLVPGPIQDDSQTAGSTPVIPAEETPEPAPEEYQAVEMASEPALEGLGSAKMQFPMLRTVGGLGLVVCLMIGLYFAARKYAPQFFTKGASAKNMKVIETLSMGDRRSLSLVEVADNRFLVGNTPHQINLLAALPNPVPIVPEPDSLRAVPQNSAKNKSGAALRNLYEIERKNPPRHEFNSLPEDIRAKMRQLRASLER
jgi:flagellar biosynthetic protein FliO